MPPGDQVLFSAVACPSGLRSTPRKRVRVYALRGFKSRRHRSRPAKMPGRYPHGTGPARCPSQFPSHLAWKLDGSTPFGEGDPSRRPMPGRGTLPTARPRVSPPGCLLEATRPKSPTGYLTEQTSRRTPSAHCVPITRACWQCDSCGLGCDVACARAETRFTGNPLAELSEESPPGASA